MSGTYFTLNQKYNNLRTQENAGGLVPVPTTSTLADVLLNGNSAGASNINMNTNDITAVDNIDLVSINGVPFVQPYTAIGMVNITEYGASTSLPDNTTAIQDAINAVPAGGTLYIPQGTFLILSDLTINTTLNIFGVGTIKAGGGVAYMLEMNAPVDIFGGLTIDGDSLAIVGIRLVNSTEVRLNNVEITGCDTGIESIGNINLTLVDCLISNMTTTGITYPTPVVAPPAIPPTLNVNNTIFRDCYKGISDIVTSNILVQGCVFDNVVFSISTGAFSATTNFFNYNITNNQFSRITGCAILINLEMTGQYNNTTISNNLFRSRNTIYTPIDVIGGTFSSFTYEVPVLGFFEDDYTSERTRFTQNTIENMFLPETTSAILVKCTSFTASSNNIGFQSAGSTPEGVFIKCLEVLPSLFPYLYLDNNVVSGITMRLVGFPTIGTGVFVVPGLSSTPNAPLFDIDTYSFGDFVMDNTSGTYAFTETFANTISLIVNETPTRIQFTNTSTAIGSVLYPTKIVNLLNNSNTPLTNFVACDGLSFPNSSQIRFGKSGTYEIVYNLATSTLTATKLLNTDITTYNAVISTSSINLTSPTFYNCIVNFTGTTASTITIPSPITNTRNNIYLGTSLQIFNNTTQEQTIQATANILGVYGSNLLTIPLPENSWYKLVVDGTNWRINERSANLTYQIPLSVNTDYSAYDYLPNATTRFAPTSDLTATIPPPTSASGGSSAHTTMNIINNSTHVLTLLSPSSIDFRGKYGRGGAGTIDTIPMPPHSYVVLYSNGNFWFANERSYNPTYYITLSTASTDASTFNYFSDASVSISSTAVTNNILVIPPPTRGEIDDATIKFFNTSVYSITLSITAGTFAGKYGNGTTTYIVPANTWVQMVTDGTNWVVLDRSTENQIYTLSLSGTTSITTNFQYINSILRVSTPSATSDTTLTLPECNTANTLSQKYTIYNTNGNTTANHFNVVLSVSTSYFKGQFQDNAGSQTTYPITPYGWVEIYSNGTNWVVSAVGTLAGAGAIIVTAGAYTIPRPFKPNYLISSTASTSLISINLPVPVFTDVGTEIVVRGLFTNGSVTRTIAIANSSTNAIYINNTSSIAPIFSASAVSVANCVARCSVQQTGIAGTGTLTITNGATTASVASVIGSTFIGLGATLTFTDSVGTTQTIVVSPVQAWGGSFGKGIAGTYTLATTYTGATTSTPTTFTCNSTYNWFIE